MKILFYMADLATGGVLTVTNRLSHALKNRGHNIIWLIQEDSPKNRFNFPKEFLCFYLPDQFISSQDNVNFVNSLIDHNKIDVIIDQHGQYEGESLFMHRQPQIPCIAVFHNHPLLNVPWLFRDLYALKDHSFIDHFKRYVRVALYWDVKQRIVKGCKVHLENIAKSNAQVVTLSEGFNPIIRQLNPDIKNPIAIGNPNTYHDVHPDFDAKEKVVLYMGRLDNGQKKISYLIRIWKMIYRQVPDWKLVIVGDGKDRDLLLKDANGIKSIEFIGFQNPEPYYKKASIVCLTSLFEGFGMALTEGMQYGCVPIAFDSYEALSDIINDGENGIKVEPFNKRQYAKQLLRLMNDKEYREQLALNAVHSVKNFDLDRIVDQWEALFDSMTKNKSDHFMIS